AGDTSSDSIGLSVESTAPEFTTDASISPASGISTSSVLNCVAAASDPDGGSIALSYEWSNGSNVIGSLSSITLGATLAQPTDEITCTVTATDDTAQTATSTDSVIVENTAPTIDSIAIVPSSGITTSSALTCTASTSDADGESLTPSYEWSNGGTIIGTGDALTLTPSLAQPSDTILCTASVFDAYGASDTSSATVAVDNTAPTIDSISITPDPAYNDDTITCNQSSSDADNQTLSESYVWTNTTTGAVLGSGTSLTLDSSVASPSDVISCALTVSDASGDSATNTTSITLGNRAPSAPTVSLTPDPAYIDDTITCTATGSSDPDGESVSYTYAWTQNGSDRSENGTTLAGSLSSGDAIVCTVTPSDGNTSGTATTASLSIANQAPTMDSLSLEPDPLYTDDTIIATASASDLEGDTLTYTYVWSVDGTIVQSGTDSTFDSSLFSKDETVSVAVTANDGSESNELTASLTCMNTAPTAPSLSLSPTTPIEQTDDLVCEISTEASDVDSDAITYAFSWTVDGASFSGATDTADSSTIDLSNTNAGEVWVCTATPNDGEEDGATASATVTIDSDWDGALTFTTCGASGKTGPSQSNCNSEYSGGLLDGQVTVTSGIQYWTVPSSGYYEIEAAGAAGGDASWSGQQYGGHGAIMVGTVYLSGGDVLKILVGQKGGSGQPSASGGGGTFVATSSNSPIIVAGGGGGSSTDHGGRDGETGTSGTGSYPNSVTSGGIGGAGGGTCGSHQYNGGAGGGFYSDGSSYGSMGGSGFISGGAGGDKDCGFDGGFGGGGGSSCNTVAGAGGGGYSGGGSGGVYFGNCSTSTREGGGGGGSYNSGTNQSNSGGANTDDGYVIIDKQ
ncbi:MAG: hypothetical protein VX278_00440, partial [Myxococcota bacterium]|nr:hypothetical protein [Myxococcota bacterium]